MNGDAPVNVVTYLRAAAERSPGREALILADGSGVTFGGLWDRVCRVSTGLRESGLQPGDRMVVMIPMSVDLYALMLGVVKLGAVAVFVDPWIKLRQIAGFAAFAEPRGFAGVPRSHLLRLFEPVLRKLPVTVTTGRRFLCFPGRTSLADLLRAPADDDVWQPESAQTPALITFTGGSSGVPKGADRTHAFLVAQYEALSREYAYSDADVDMPMFPVFALRNLAEGITSVVPDMDFRQAAEVDGARILAQMARHGVTTCTASPPFVERLAEAALDTGTDPCLRRILSGGSPVSDEMLRHWREAFPKTEISIVYGSTEAEPVASIALEERLSCHGEGVCVGKPIETVSCRVIDIRRGPASLAGVDAQAHVPGRIGELIVAGEHVCRGYFRNPDAVAENKIVDDSGTLWHRMGDTGYFDADGRFWLTGRLHSTIFCKGEPLHAQLLEAQVMKEIPADRKAAAVEFRDTLVIVVQGEEIPDLRQTLRQSGIPVDRVFFTLRPFPVDPRHNAKTDYSKLRHLLEEGRL